MDIRLRIRRHRDGRVVLDLGILFRLFFVAIAVLLVAIWVSAGSLGFFGIVLLGVSVFATLYDERWEINPATHTVTARHGIVGLWRRRTWEFTSIVVVRAVRYWSGTVPRLSRNDSSESTRRTRFFQRQHVRYELITGDGETVRIETRRIHSAEEPWELPDTVAKAIGTNLERSEG